VTARRPAARTASRRPVSAAPGGGKAVTKAEIVEHIYERVGFSKKESAELVEKVFEIIKETLAQGEKVKISGFGNFVVREKNARKGRNPQTGEEIRLAARRVLTFKPSLVLKNVLNDEPISESEALRPRD
jgi:integration host factor subunit alpha